MDQKSPEATARVEGAPYPLGAPPTSWLPSGPPDLFVTQTPLIYPQTSRTEPRSGLPPPQASVCTKNQSRPCSGTLPEGGSITGGHIHHPCANMADARGDIVHLDLVGSMLGARTEGAFPRSQRTRTTSPETTTPTSPPARQNAYLI